MGAAQRLGYAQVDRDRGHSNDDDRVVGRSVGWNCPRNILPSIPRNLCATNLPHC